jgi:hypothetical protein
LEIIDRVCEAAWAQLEAREPFRDRDHDDERRESLWRLVMDQTGTDRVEFDTLYDKVLANLPEAWVTFANQGNPILRFGWDRSTNNWHV